VRGAGARVAGRPRHSTALTALVALAVAGLPRGVGAAPLDVLLSALPEQDAQRHFVELSVSGVNRSIDFSDPEDDPAIAARAADGDYRDVQLAGGWRVRDELWLTGGVWQRTLDSGIDRYRYLSWQLAGQARLRDAAGGWPAVALRLGAWGNRASATETTSPVRVPGAILDSVKISRPADRQLQADLLGTWVLRPGLDLTALVSVGSIQLSYGGLTATTTRSGCHYDLQFNGNDIFGNLAAPCESSGGVIQQFYDSSGEYGVEVANEIAWRGRFAQAGLNLRWAAGPWTLKAGYLVHAVRRDAIDDILRERGRPVHEHNRILALQGDYRITPTLSVLLRAQLSSNLFFNDLPVTYNSSTSANFGNRLSLYTLGMRADF